MKSELKAQLHSEPWHSDKSPMLSFSVSASAPAAVREPSRRTRLQGVEGEDAAGLSQGRSWHTAQVLFWPTPPPHTTAQGSFAQYTSPGHTCVLGFLLGVRGHTRGPPTLCWWRALIWNPGSMRLTALSACVAEDTEGRRAGTACTIPLAAWTENAQLQGGVWDRTVLPLLTAHVPIARAGFLLPSPTVVFL